MSESEAQETPDTLELSRALAELIHEKKGEDLKILEVREVLPVCDYFVIATGRNAQHLSSLTDHIQDRMKEWTGVHPQGVEGKNEALWILIDYGYIVIHLFQEHIRDYYRMENLWADAPTVALSEEETVDEEDTETELEDTEEQK